VYIYINTSGKKYSFLSHNHSHSPLPLHNKVVLLDTEILNRLSQFTEKSLVFDHYKMENFESQCFKVFELEHGQPVVSTKCTIPQNISPTLHTSHMSIPPDPYLWVIVNIILIESTRLNVQ